MEMEQSTKDFLQALSVDDPNLVADYFTKENVNNPMLSQLPPLLLSASTGAMKVMMFLIEVPCDVFARGMLNTNVLMQAAVGGR
jgi:hypothetical protein